MTDKTKEQRAENRWIEACVRATHAEAAMRGPYADINLFVNDLAERLRAALASRSAETPHDTEARWRDDLLWIDNMLLPLTWPIGLGSLSEKVRHRVQEVAERLRKLNAERSAETRRETVLLDGIKQAMEACCKNGADPSDPYSILRDLLAAHPAVTPETKTEWKVGDEAITRQPECGIGGCKEPRDHAWKHRDARPFPPAQTEDAGQMESGRMWAVLNSIHNVACSSGDKRLIDLASEAGRLLAAMDRDDDATACGHPAALLDRSVESDYTFCELCEARDRLRDALTMEKSLSDQRDRFFRDMLVMLSGHGICTPERGYGSHGDGYGHIISDVDRALSRHLTRRADT